MSTRSSSRSARVPRRPLLFALTVCASLALAGCAQPDEGVEEEIADPGGELVAMATHDHREAPEEHTFTLAEEGYYDMVIRFRPYEENICATEGGGAREGDEALVTVYDPEGVVFTQFSPTQDASIEREAFCGSLERTGLFMQEGTWSVAFTGSSPVEGEFLLEHEPGGAVDDEPPVSHL